MVALGSNLGDRHDYLRRARAALSHEESGGRFKLLHVGEIIETEALLFGEQPPFLNQLVECRTSLDPFETLAALKSIERQLGRVERFRWGPREIDLDIILYGEKKIQSSELTIPHPGLADRPYLQLLLQKLEESLADTR